MQLASQITIGIFFAILFVLGIASALSLAMAPRLERAYPRDGRC